MDAGSESCLLSSSAILNRSNCGVPRWLRRHPTCLGSARCCLLSGCGTSTARCFRATTARMHRRSSSPSSVLTEPRRWITAALYSPWLDSASAATVHFATRMRSRSCRCRAQNLVGAFELAVLPLQLLQAFAIRRAQSGALAFVTLGLLHPTAQGDALVQPILPARRLDRRPLRAILIWLLGDHPHRSVSDCC